MCRVVVIAILMVFGTILGTAIVGGSLWYRDYRLVEVSVGTRYICCESDCRKEYKNTVKEIKVARKDISNYRVKVDSSFPCPKCTVKVYDGERIICPECERVIKDTIRELRVAKSQAKKYHVEKRHQICAECKEEAERLGSKDPIDREIIRQLKQKYYKYPEINFGLIYSERDFHWWHEENRIDARVQDLLIYHLAHHKIAIRLVDGYDDEEHMITRESYYPNPSDRNISAHYSGQAIDILIADGVEIAWQASLSPAKRQRAQDKIRELIREIFDIGRQNNFLLPTQIIVYKQEDVEHFANDIRTLYGATQAQRGLSGMMWSDPMLDRIHIGY